MPFESIDPKKPLASFEPEILRYWKIEDIFKRSIAERKLPDGDTSNEFTFYDGPPFATGLPHYGHLLAGTIKDVIGRYQTMKGNVVERRFGWDCHGLPIENIIEKEQNITDHKQITDELGIDAFCEMCRSAVLRYTEDWRTTVERIGRWVDMDYDYRTMDPEFMESIWWAFSQLYKQGLIYEGHKPMHICPRCVTPLSNFEVTQGYLDIVDTSVIAEFTLEDGRIALAWTTTPWTLPSNFLLAVGSEITYSEVGHEGKTYVVAEELVAEIFKDKEHNQKGTVLGKDLVGIRYEPLFPYFAKEYEGKALYIAAGDFVTTSDGTGIVHIAPFGEDDYNLSVQENLTPIINVTMDGKFTDQMGEFAGQPVKPKGDHSSMDNQIAKWLKQNGKLFNQTQYKHSYPHCWRCDSPLLNYLTGSWFVSIEKIKPQMLKNKEQTHWVPSHLRDGRYGQWLENARDWAISRNRFWGTPLPIWRSPDGEIETVNSRDALMSKEQLRFTKVTALRHGESEGNLTHTFQGEAPGTSLTEKGKDQAQKTANYLAKQKVDVIYASPMARTQETAAIIAKATGAEIITDERLIERNFGPHEGTTSNYNNHEDRVAARAHKIDTNSADELDAKDGMEPYSKVQERVQEFFDEVLPRHRSEHIVVVSHGTVVRTAPAYFTSEDPVKLSYHPTPAYAKPYTYFWDHKTGTQMDLHKHRIDDITWAVDDAKPEECCELTFVRHGETDFNAKELVAGHTDCALNENGKKQAEATAKKLAGKHFDVILCSDLKRTKQTADIINATLQVTDLHYKESLRERDYGDLHGKTYAYSLEKMGVESMMTFFDLEDTVSGEHSEAFYQRAVTKMQKVLREYKGKKVLIVSHGHFIRKCLGYINNLNQTEVDALDIKNAEPITVQLKPQFERIPEVLDCWFESGSMPYAKAHYPFYPNPGKVPNGFPADFIAEGIDQCRAWFYTLMALSTALFEETPFKNVVVNGIVLAEDGKKMSKKLKNYPEPTLLLDKYGADSIRFTLMNSPAVRGEDLRMSEQLVEQSLRSVLLPLWNTYSFFITYANAANFEPEHNPTPSVHPLDQYVTAELKDLVNRMTEELDGYDLSATCSQLFSTIDALTNWYVRLSRRRFAGKDGVDTQTDALQTLHNVLLQFAQVLAPFCPFIAEHMYRNLTHDEHGSVHLTDWPAITPLTELEQDLLTKMRTMRHIVSLGLSVRGEAKIKNRQPLSKATVAVPSAVLSAESFTAEDLQILQQELNVKHIEFAANPEELAVPIAQVNARLVGPRLGKRVQEIITAGKAGQFTQNDDGTVTIANEVFTAEEVQVVYQGKEDGNIAADKGVVVHLETALSTELEQEGVARDLIRTIQRLRKESGYEFTELLTISITGFDDVLENFTELVTSETNTELGAAKGASHKIEIGTQKGTITFV